MEIITADQLQEWLRLDPNTDLATLNMLVSAGVHHVEHITGTRLRPYLDPLTSTTITPTVPESLKHAVAVFVSAHFDDRSGDDAAAMRTIAALCRPFVVARL